ncbi:MAG: MATE family efflux transporter [Prevotella sp.]|nr:MATE family efflux transporter [Prevotella sp.]
MNPRDNQILKIAIPSIVSNITVPLLGLVDVAITGHLGAAAYIAAISIGSMVFNTTYWLFGFLRMGSSGLTSQALGRRDLQEVTMWLVRGLVIAMGIGLLLILAQWPIREMALWLMRPEEEVRQMVITYFHICIWGAPAMLGLYTLNGWFIGMQNSRIPMVVAIVQNIINILVSLFLVFGLHMKVEGVASGTLIAQWVGFLLALALLFRFYGRHLKSGECRVEKLFSKSALRKFFIVNRDLFFRTVCLVSVMLFFTTAGSWQGEVTLAANTLLMQFFLLVSYVVDGFANAAEAMSGKYWGARNLRAFAHTVKHCFMWGYACAFLFSVIYIVGGDAFVALLTDEPTVVDAAHEYIWWIYLIPVCSIGAFIWDGVFVGITASREMLITSLVAAVVFFLLFAWVYRSWGNHGLWLSFLVYLLIRGVLQTVFFHRSLMDKQDSLL